MTKKILAVLLVAVMVAGLLPVTAFADCAHSTWKEASDKSYHFCSSCSEKCYGSVTREIVVNCNNNNGKKVTKLGCELCSYVRTGNIFSDGVDHAYNGAATCSVCGQPNPEYVPPCKHDWKNDGTCKNNCGATCSHNYVRTTPECGPNKSIVDNCSICGNMQVIGPVPATHTLPDGATGNLTCSVCNASVYIAPPHTHDYAKDGVGNCTVTGCDAQCPHDDLRVVYKDCVKSDYDQQICDTCNYVYSNTYPKTYSAHEYNSEKLCVHCGAEKDPCVQCDYDNTTGNCKECGEPHDHDYQWVMPNCTSGGYKTDFCQGCGHIRELLPADAVAHTFVNGVCSVCGQTNDCVHEWEWSTAKCKKCGDSHLHAAGDLTLDHPSCTEGGYVREICNVCGYILVKSGFEPMDHDLVNGVCTRCGYKVPEVKKASTVGLDDVPKTGDNRFFEIGVAAVSVLFGMGVILFRKRETV